MTEATAESRLGRWRQWLGPAGFYPLVMLFLFNMVDEFDRVAFGALSPEIRDEFGLSNSAFLSIVSLSAALPILLAVPVGYVADRTNRVRLSQAAALVWSVAAIVVGLAPVLAVLIVARLVGGVGRLVNEPVHPSLLSDYYPPARLPRIFGMHRWANTAGLAAAPVAGVIGSVWGWRTAFIAMALPTFALVAFSARLREPRRTMATEDHEKVTVGEGFRRVRAIRSLRRTWLAAFLFGSGVLPVTSFLTLFFEDVYGMGPVVRGLITGLAGAGGTVGLLIGSRLADRAMTTGRPQLLPVITGVMIVGFGVGLFLMGAAPWLAVSVFFAFALYIGAQGFLPAYLSMVALTAPPRLRAQAFSYSLLFYALGGLVLSPIAGAIGDSNGLRVGVIVLSALVAAGGLVEITVRAFVARDIEQAATSTSAKALADEGALLVCKGVDVAYDQVQVLFGVDFQVQEGEVVALLGTNGAGKTTLLRAISGTVDPMGGAIYFAGRDITHADANTTAALGIVQVPGGRGIFPSLTVMDNLRAAGWLYRRQPGHRKDAVEKVLDQFPILLQRRNLLAGSLSGGEQQMLSLGMAFVARPRLLLIDELSLGLAPTIVDRLLEIVRAIHDAGTTVVLVEQSVNTALQLADRCSFMEKGEVRYTGLARELLERPEILRSVFLEGSAAALEGDGPARPVRRSKRARQPAPDAPPKPVVLETVGLSKRYGGITAVDSVDLRLHEGEILGLIGPNGAGKTTIFDLISGFQKADEGRVILHGVDVTETPPAARAMARLGRTFQDAKLFPSLTVTEALAVAFERHVAIRAALPALMGTRVVAQSEARVGVGVHELIELMGLGSFRDKFVSELSTGTRRMVEIAAMVAHGPSVLILDEPSSGIAQRETEALVPLLRAVRDHMNCSLLVIEHDMPLITSLAERIVALEQGRVIAVGTPQEIVRDPQVIESYLGSMAEELQLS